MSLISFCLFFVSAVLYTILFRIDIQMAINKHFLRTIILIWPLLLLVGFVSIYLPKVSVSGYRWSVELVLALFIAIAAFIWLFAKDKPSVSFSITETFWILLPIAVFITWSGVAILWSDSWRAATHHTLLWALYLLFYVLLRIALTDTTSEQTAVKVLGIVIFIISSAGAIEFLGSAKPITLEFTTRFYSYGEAIISLLPLFAAVAISRKSKRRALWFMLVGAGWFLVVATMSRTMFVAGLFGVAAFWILSFRFSSESSRVGLYFAMIAVLAIFTLAPQLTLLSGQSSSLTQRLAGSDEDSRLSARARLPWWGMAIEGFRLHPITGIGGDNFYSDYKLLRASYSARDPNNELLEIGEDILPERAHNEFLQIFCELGLVGGAFFVWLILGICSAFFYALRNRASATTIASFCGIFAFLVASISSSYSFRFTTNGLCFFFLLAIGSSEVFKKKSEFKEYRFPMASIILLCLIVSFLTIGFCTARATSVWHFANSQNTQNPATAKDEIERAIAIDPSEPVFRYYKAEQLYIAGDYENAIPEFRQAIDKGIATSPVYFDLLAALMISGDEAKILSTFEEAILVYPRSVFLRTAYASYLRRLGRSERAEEQFQYALRINEKQARSWQLAHNAGLEQLVKTSRVDDRYLSPFNLKPPSAPIALANFQKK